MPKEEIYSSSLSNLNHVHVGWTKGVTADIGIVDPLNPPALGEYQYVMLGPKEIDKLIKTLRRAKKQAYGTRKEL